MVKPEMLPLPSMPLPKSTLTSLALYLFGLYSLLLTIQLLISSGILRIYSLPTTPHTHITKLVYILNTLLETVILYAGYRDLGRRYGRRQGKVLWKAVVAVVATEISMVVGVMVCFGMTEEKMLRYVGGNWFLVGLGGMGMAEMYVLQRMGRREVREWEEGEV